MDDKTRAHIFISGQVQGIGLRFWTTKQATELNLTGFVKNLEDGRVEAAFEGEKEKIEKIIELIGEGPMLAQIDDVKIFWERHQGEFRDFRAVA